MFYRYLCEFTFLACVRFILEGVPVRFMLEGVPVRFILEGVPQTLHLLSPLQKDTRCPGPSGLGRRFRHLLDIWTSFGHLDIFWTFGHLLDIWTSFIWTDQVWLSRLLVSFWADP